MTAKTLLDTPVRDLMSTELVTASPTTTMLEIDELLTKHNIHHIPVVDDNGAFVGIVSKVDVQLCKDWATELKLRSSSRANAQILNSQLATDRMKKQTVNISPDDKLKSCVKHFKENRFRALPVIEDGKLVGLITTYDLMIKAYS